MSYKCRIELILGPMYSGKSTELIRRTSRYEAIGKNILIINSVLDSRTDNSVKTHSNNKKKAIKTKNLLNILDLDLYKNSEVIGVDEGQFFDDLLDFVKIVEKTDKILIIAGLDGDYKREPFGDILKCIPLCDELIKLSAMCMHKNDGTPSSFTKRIVNSNNQTLIGAKDSYITVSREGYFKK
jgi:thymidine kinase